MYKDIQNFIILLVLLVASCDNYDGLYFAEALPDFENCGIIARDMKKKNLRFNLEECEHHIDNPKYKIGQEFIKLAGPRYLRGTRFKAKILKNSYFVPFNQKTYEYKKAYYIEFIEEHYTDNMLILESELDREWKIKKFVYGVRE